MILLPVLFLIIKNTTLIEFLQDSWQSDALSSMESYSKDGISPKVEKKSVSPDPTTSVSADPLKPVVVFYLVCFVLSIIINKYGLSELRLPL